MYNSKLLGSVILPSECLRVYRWGKNSSQSLLLLLLSWWPQLIDLLYLKMGAQKAIGCVKGGYGEVHWLTCPRNKEQSNSDKDVGAADSLLMIWNY